MNYYFTSDVHFHHKRILDFCKHTRLNAKTVEENNELLIEKWNSRVTNSDIVYHLGDFSFGSIEQTLEVLSRLKGQKHFIMGNHDGPLLHPQVRKKLQDLKDYKEIRIENIKVCLFHFPMHEWHQCHRGAFHLFGHVHDTYRTTRGKSLNVGIDARPERDMLPWNWEEIKAYMADKEIITHHGKLYEAYDHKKESE